MRMPLRLHKVAGYVLIAWALVATVLLLPKCEGPGPHPFTQTGLTSTVHSCTPAFGQCEVTQFIHHRLNGTVWEETCEAQPPIRPGASNVWIAVYDCYRP